MHFKVSRFVCVLSILVWSAKRTTSDLKRIGMLLDLRYRQGLYMNDLRVNFSGSGMCCGLIIKFHSTTFSYAKQNGGIGNQGFVVDTSLSFSILLYSSFDSLYILSHWTFLYFWIIVVCFIIVFIDNNTIDYFKIDGSVEFCHMI